jgi:hypothetical protein
MDEDLRNLLGTSFRIRNDILAECRITKATLSNWANGKTSIPFWAQEKINAIARKETGKELFTF